MPKRSIALFRVSFAVFLIAFLTVHLAAALCWGSDKSPADPTITLNVDNEPLRSVFAKISKTTSWKIQAPDKWMNRPITQSLTGVPLADGLRFILKSAGIENILLLYDDNNRVITVFDTENLVKQSNAVPPVQATGQPSVVPPTDDRVLKRRTSDAGSSHSPGSSRAKRRTHKEEE